MPQRDGSPAPVTVTMIARSDCPTCCELSDELAPLQKMSYILLKTINVDIEQPPPFAQDTIVPATYIGEELWRFGKYPRAALEERVKQEISPENNY